MDTYYPSSEPSGQVNHTREPELAPVMSFGDWLVTLIVSSIPVANIIVLLIWAFSPQTNPNRRNFALAMISAIAAYCVIIAMYIGYIAGFLYNLSEMLH